MKARRKLGVALIGHGFMGKAHSNAWRQAPHFFELPGDLRMKTICGRDRARLKKDAARLGWETWQTDWRSAVADPEIDIVDVCTPNNTHCEIATFAAEQGKAILCEKPLALNLREAQSMARLVRRRRVVNMVCHNYRRIPAVALARQMIERGELGDRIFHYHARYAQDWIVDPDFPDVWRLQADVSGSGATGDILSHIIDLGRYLVGEFREICAAQETFIKERRESARRGARRRKVTVDDTAIMIGKFRNGAMASLEATRFAPGRKNGLTFEINGSEGSLCFDLEEMNRLRFFSRRDRPNEQGFRDILTTEPTHPYIEAWWPPGHIIGYEHTFVHTVVDFVRAVVTRKKVQPDFEDGLSVQRVLDAVQRSAKSRRWVKL
jgi:predicted dehydrogenase